MGRLTECRGLVTRTAATAIALLAGACGHGGSRPVRLIDGTTPARLPIALRTLDSAAVLTRVVVLRAGALRVRDRTCLASFRPEFRIAADPVVVRRTGVAGESLTFEDVNREVVLGCDRASRPRSAPGAWCGRSVGRLIAGRVRDMRLDIACRTSRDTPLGFGWIQPATGTRWIAADVGSLTEIHEVVAGLPVRLVTEDVDLDRSSATFSIVEYTQSGRALRTYRLRAGVAG